MGKIESLQVFRGLAALAVVLTHTNTATGAFITDVPIWVDDILKHGYLGVDFFFVLSGFIIMYSHSDDEQSLLSSKRYIIKRLARIFPPYLPICIALLILYNLFPGFSASGGYEYSLISSLLLLPSSSPPVLSVAWTLIHELLFYFIFLSYFLSRIIFFAVSLVWLLAIFHLEKSVNTGFSIYVLSPLNIEFLFGVTAAKIFQQFLLVKQQKIVINISSISVVIGFLISYISLYHSSIVGPLERVLFALGLAFIVLGVTYLDQQLFKFKWPKFFVLLGNASFSIYLVHNPLLSVTQRLFGGVPYISWPLGLFLGVSGGVIGGLIYFFLVERPLTYRVRNLLSRV